jgi:hypothetical protein
MDEGNGFTFDQLASGCHTGVTPGARQWQLVVPLSRDADATTKMPGRQ